MHTGSLDLAEQRKFVENQQNETIETEMDALQNQIHDLKKRIENFKKHKAKRDEVVRCWDFNYMKLFKKKCQTKVNLLG